MKYKKLANKSILTQVKIGPEEGGIAINIKPEKSWKRSEA